MRERESERERERERERETDRERVCLAVAVHRVGGLLMVENSYSQMWVERVRLRHQTY